MGYEITRLDLTGGTWPMDWAKSQAEAKRQVDRVVRAIEGRGTLGIVVARNEDTGEIVYGRTLQWEVRQ